MKMPVEPSVLNSFLTKASEHCYLGDFMKARVENPERKGFFELEYTEGDLSYRDSFVGFYMSAGQEIIRYKDIPIWSSSYAGGVNEEYHGNVEFFREVETFLRKSLSQGKTEVFQARGPELFTESDWSYKCEWSGDITNFYGLEEIFYKNEKVFFHRFFGGTIVGK